MPNDFVTVQYLSTFAGLVVVLGLIVQFTKGLIKQTFSDQAVRLYAFVWALILVALVNWHQGMFEVAAREAAVALLLTLINAILITLTAMGGYELVVGPKNDK